MTVDTKLQKIYCFLLCQYYTIFEAMVLGMEHDRKETIMKKFLCLAVTGILFVSLVIASAAVPTSIGTYSSYTGLFDDTLATGIKDNSLTNYASHVTYDFEVAFPCWIDYQPSGGGWTRCTSTLTATANKTHTMAYSPVPLAFVNMRLRRGGSGVNTGKSISGLINFN